MKDKTGIIYKWTNKINNKSYIGQTVNPRKRYNEHCRAKTNDYFHYALRKYGKDNFDYVVLEDNIERSMLNDREIYWIKYYDTFKNGYNMTEGGHQLSPLLYTEERNKKISMALKGKPLSKETIEKLSKVRRGRKLTEEWKQNISKNSKHIGPNKGRKKVYNAPNDKSKGYKLLKIDIDNDDTKTDEQ